MMAWSDLLATPFANSNKVSMTTGSPATSNHMRESSMVSSGNS